MTPDFSAQFRPRDVWNDDTMLRAWWWAMYWPWMACSTGTAVQPSSIPCNGTPSVDETVDFLICWNQFSIHKENLE